MIDYVDVDLRSAMLAVRDQEARPTCLAHAVTAAHEHARGAAAHLSPEYLHFFASRRAPESSTGIFMQEVSEALEVDGQSEEVQCPYLLQDPPSGWKPPTRLTVFRRASEPKPATAAAVERWIRAGCVPVLGITVPLSFLDPTPPWVISPQGSQRGLHAVVGIGLGRHEGHRVFLIRNSWGADWGDGGYAWLDEPFMAQHLKEALLLTHEVYP